MTLESVVLGLAALVFLAVGVQGLFVPRLIVGPLGGSLVSPSFANEIRANYGGMHTAIATLFAIGAAKGEFALPALALLFGFCAGLCVGRSWSWLNDGAPNRFVRVFFVLEAVGALAAGALILRR
jgi:hypothetical protein